MNKQSKPLLRTITALFFIWVLILTSNINRANAVEDDIIGVQCMRYFTYAEVEFTAYAQPDLTSEVVGRFNPQYVHVLSWDAYNWIEISTYRGAAWINLVHERERPQMSAQEIWRRSQWNHNTVVAAAWMLAGEAGSSWQSLIEWKLPVWIAINRFEVALASGNPWHTYFRNGRTIHAIITDRNQFHGRRAPTQAHFDAALEVFEAWSRGESQPVYAPFALCGRVLYFRGDGRHNWYRPAHTGGRGCRC